MEVLQRGVISTAGPVMVRAELDCFRLHLRERDKAMFVERLQDLACGGYLWILFPGTKYLGIELMSCPETCTKGLGGTMI